MRASAPTNDSSSATASGACSWMSALTPSKIILSRSSGRSRAPDVQHPWARALIRPSLSWTIPYPHAAVPGSMPRTFTARGYGALGRLLISQAGSAERIPARSSPARGQIPKAPASRRNCLVATDARRLSDSASLATRRPPPAPSPGCRSSRRRPARRRCPRAPRRGARPASRSTRRRSRRSSSAPSRARPTRA